MIEKSILHRIRDVKYYGIMVDECIDCFFTSHLGVFVTFVEDSQIFCVFLDLLNINDNKKDVTFIFEILFSSLREWELDPSKCCIWI